MVGKATVEQLAQHIWALPEKLEVSRQEAVEGLMEIFRNGGKTLQEQEVGRPWLGS